MYSYEYPHPAVTVDVAVFCREQQTTKILLIQRAHFPDAGKWALPGGFIEIDEELEQAARRELHEETGLTVGTLQQLHTFGQPDRDPRERVITVVFTAVIDPEAMKVTAASDAAAAAWFDIDALPELAFDHPEVIAMACERVVPTLAF